MRRAAANLVNRNKYLCRVADNRSEEHVLADRSWPRFGKPVLRKSIQRRLSKQ